VALLTPMTQLAAAPDTTVKSQLKLAACVLLAGSLRPSPLAAAAGCSVLDLYLTPTRTVLDTWLHHFEEVASAVGQQPAVHVIYGLASPAPTARPSTSLELRLQEDPQQFRGPAGAVRDACTSYDPESTLIVAEAARAYQGDLTQLITSHLEQEADVTVACNPDSTPAGLFVIRCATLDLIPQRGFTDLKEQWLRKVVDAGHQVRVHRLKNAHSHQLRTREGFLHAAAISGGLVTSARGDGAVTAAGMPPNGVGENVSIGARSVIVDSVVMPGASIGDDAVVARSILCPGASIARGGTVVNGVVGAGREIVG
jgi:hypothetical protein